MGYDYYSRIDVIVEYLSSSGTETLYLDDIYPKQGHYYYPINDNADSDFVDSDDDSEIIQAMSRTRENYGQDRHIYKENVWLVKNSSKEKYIRILNKHNIDEKKLIEIRKYLNVWERM